MKKEGSWEIGLGILVILTSFVSGYAAVVIGAVSLIGLGVYRMRPAAGSAARNTEEIAEKQAHVSRVMALVHERHEVGNDDVRALLGVSEDTARRYLQELESAGRIVQMGDTGRGVVYTLK